jgi:NADH:ubiquinone reductase (H+-translocating)
MPSVSARILVIGAGYAGLVCTMRLAGKVSCRQAQITLINDHDTFTERLRLHQYATNQPIHWRSIPQLLQRTQIAFVQGRVLSIDPDQRTVAVEERQQTRHVAYDYLSMPWAA